MANRSKLLRLTVRNLRCVGPEGVTIELDQIVCLVGKNNAGKSTILRAYELAQGSENFDPLLDRCRWAPPDQATSVELDIHIPDGIANIDPKWKISDGDYRIVRSRWEWLPDTYEKKRTTWSPEENAWAADGKAGGADNVFKSRLPHPLRIGSLEDAHKTEEVLLALALDPLVTQMGVHEANPDSSLSKSLSAVATLVNDLASAHKTRFDEISTEVQKGFVGVFPNLTVRLDVGMAPPTIKVKELLKSGSGMRIKEGKYETTLAQQGTGTRRALFWAMLQVHNDLKRKADLVAERKKSLLAKQKKAKDGEAKAELQKQIDAIDAQPAPADADADDPALPGYLLLIDEPENALHPLAARSAQRHLYRLATDPDWQVMMTTHSPYFVNPLEDHTTIVRLERIGGDEGPLQSKTYVADGVVFDNEEKRWLQAVQQMDTGFSEVFFGSYPILVEGDTEHAAFIAAVLERKHHLQSEITVVRARGKAIIPPLIRMLAHFKVSFGVVHDIDWPYNRKKGGASAMWSVNRSIMQEIAAARNAGLRVRHRFSVPDFERFLGAEEVSADKPLETYLLLMSDQSLSDKVQNLFSELYGGEKDHQFEKDVTPDNVLDYYLESLNDWAAKNESSSDPRLVGLASKT